LGDDSSRSIGEILDDLRGDFPDISVSKIRFLESQGLITPERSPSGYRQFTDDDLELLRWILRQQRDHYLPLKVIRRYLADLDAGKNPAWPGTPQGGPSMLATERRYSRDELLAESGGSAALLDDAVATGLMPAAETYGEDEAGAMKALADLASAGIEPRHLRAMRIAAEREMELIGNALLPMRRRADGASRAKADLRAAELAAQLEVVRARLVKSALARQTA
jgi:DNA-binding transcriptional MerR regulator